MRALGRAMGVGLVAGLVWGVVARAYMRLLTTDPAFTWSGTLAIVISASVVGGLVMVVRAARRQGRSAWWRLLGLPYVLLFGGAGVTLVPGVIGVVMLLDRRRWLRGLGAGCLGLLAWFLLAEEPGWPTARQWAGLAVLFACLAVQGWAARELVRRWSPEEAPTIVRGDASVAEVRSVTVG